MKPIVGLRTSRHLVVHDHYPLPIALGVGIFALGWWVSRTARHRAMIPEDL